MIKYLFLTFLLTVTFQNSSAQLVSWTDIMEVEGLQADHRIYFGEDSLQFGDLWLPDDEIRNTIILIHGMLVKRLSGSRTHESNGC